MSDNNGGNFTNSFLLGVVFGFVVGVLAAPRSGREMRDEINERTRGIRDQVEHMAARVRHQLHREADANDESESSRS